MRGPAPRVQGGQGTRMANNLVVSQQRQQQNQTMSQAQTQPQNVMYVQPQFLAPLNFGKFPGAHFNAHAVSHPKVRVFIHTHTLQLFTG